MLELTLREEIGLALALKDEIRELEAKLAGLRLVDFRDRKVFQRVYSQRRNALARAGLRLAALTDGRGFDTTGLRFLARHCRKCGTQLIGEGAGRGTFCFSCGHWRGGPREGVSA